MTNSSLPPSMAKAHKWVRDQAWLGRFTLMNRILLAMAFIPTGLVKATGNRFTLLPVETPVGFFFEAMYQSGPFWYFIGFCQIAAGILLLIPATATIGAVLFLPIGFSIFLITYGIGFGGTVYVTAGMLLSVIYLVCWDADKIWAAASNLLTRREGPKLLENAPLAEKAAWAIGGAVGIALFLTTRGFLSPSLRPELFFVGVGACLVVVGSWIYLAVQGARKPTTATAKKAV